MSQNQNKIKVLRSQLGGQVADKIVKTVKTTGAVVTGPIPLPTHKKIFYGNTFSTR